MLSLHRLLGQANIRTIELRCVPSTASREYIRWLYSFQQCSLHTVVPDEKRPVLQPPLQSQIEVNRWTPYVVFPQGVPKPGGFHVRELVAAVDTREYKHLPAAPYPRPQGMNNSRRKYRR
jgi:hypothetical protein